MSNFCLNEGEKKHLGVKNDREWRKRKRRELDAVIKAADVYLVGAAYTPASALPLVFLCREMREKLSVERWGR